MISPLPEFSVLADKVAVREYVKNIVGKNYLIPVHGVFPSITYDIFAKLPDGIVIKGNHGAGQAIIIRNKSDVSFDFVFTETNKWISVDYGKKYREQHYSSIKPRIIVEQALLNNGKPPKDFKVHVFKKNNDTPPLFFIQIIDGRGNNLTQSIYTETWEKAPFWRDGYKESHYTDDTPKPKQLNEMLGVAEKLTGSLGYARIDFYIHNNRIYFGEITLTPFGGRIRLTPGNYDRLLGDRFSWPDHFNQITNK